MTKQVWNSVEADIAQCALFPINKGKDEYQICYIIKPLIDCLKCDRRWEPVGLPQQNALTTECLVTWPGFCQTVRSSCRQERIRVQYLLVKVDPLQQSVTLHYHNFLLLLSGDEGCRPPGYQQPTELAGSGSVPGPSSVLSIFATHFIRGWRPTVPCCENRALLEFLSLKLTSAQRRQYRMPYLLNPIYNLF